MPKMVFLPLLLAALTAGCVQQPPAAPPPLPPAAFVTADVPVAKPIASDPQGVVRASQHLQAVARDAAREIRRMMGNEPNLPIYVKRIGEASYHTTLHEYLTTELIRQGLALVARPTGGLILEYSTQIVRYPSARGAVPSGQLTPLGFGVYALRGPGEAASSEELLTYAVVNQMLPKAEINFHVSVINPRSEKYVARKSETYYLSDDAEGLFSDNGGRKGIELRNVRVTDR